MIENLVGLSQKFAEMAQFYVGSPYALARLQFVYLKGTV
jgi:hypothetical protein